MTGMAGMEAKAVLDASTVMAGMAVMTGMEGKAGMDASVAMAAIAEV
jgi:hypothetical protein